MLSSRRWSRLEAFSNNQIREGNPYHETLSGRGVGLGKGLGVVVADGGVLHAAWGNVFQASLRAPQAQFRQLLRGPRGSGCCPGVRLLSATGTVPAAGLYHPLPSPLLLPAGDRQSNQDLLRTSHHLSHQPLLRAGD